VTRRPASKPVALAHRRQSRAFACLAALLLSSLAPAVLSATEKAPPRNYAFFGQTREDIHRKEFSDEPAFAGAQIAYPWRKLEPAKDRYDFSEIAADLAFLKSKGKRLFLQLQDVSFSPKIKNVPMYLQTEPEYHHGADPQYEFANDHDAQPRVAGWVARRWDPAVADRFHKLLGALARRFDGELAGINLPETAVDFGSTGKFHPPGFTPPGYRDAIRANMAAARAAFQHSAVIQYANFMPGEWLPWDDKGYLASLFESAKKLGVGIGGPDLIPYKKAQMNHSYHFASAKGDALVIGYAVQDGNYSQKNVKTGKRMTVGDIYDFARRTLKTDFIFWCTEEPYFTRDVLPFLRRAG